MDDYDRIKRLSGMDIFEQFGDHKRGGFKFVVPGVMLSADDVRVDFDREAKGWVLTYIDAGRTWTGRGDSQTHAYLDLIADRCGLHESEATDG